MKHEKELLKSCLIRATAFHKTYEPCYNVSMETRAKKRDKTKLLTFTPAEKRAAKSERIKVAEAVPFGWIAHSESESEHDYRIYCEPTTRRLVCTCADFIFSGNGEPGFECKHVSAVLKFIARQYLRHEYDPHRQHSRVA